MQSSCCKRDAKQAAARGNPSCSSNATFTAVLSATKRLLRAEEIHGESFGIRKISLRDITGPTGFFRHIKMRYSFSLFFPLSFSICKTWDFSVRACSHIAMVDAIHLITGYNSSKSQFFKVDKK